MNRNRSSKMCFDTFIRHMIQLRRRYVESGQKIPPILNRFPLEYNTTDPNLMEAQHEEFDGSAEWLLTMPRHPLLSDDHLAGTLRDFHMELFLLSSIYAYYLSWLKFNPEGLIERFVVLLGTFNDLMEHNATWRRIVTEQRRYEFQNGMALFTSIFAKAINESMRTQRKVLLSIDPDVHGLAEFDDLKFTTSVIGKSDDLAERVEVTGDDLPLKPGAIAYITIPVEWNEWMQETQINLQLTSKDNQTLALHVSLLESNISGYTGHRKMLRFMPDGINWIQVVLRAQWEVWPRSNYNTDEIVDILSRTPGALLLAGDYYWHYFRIFFYKMARCTYPHVRTTVMRALKQLSPCMSRVSHKKDLLPLFRYLYRLNRPELEKHVYRNPLVWVKLLLPNLIYFFKELNHQEQIHHLGHIIPAIDQTEVIMMPQLAKLLHCVLEQMGNWADHEVETMVVQMALRLLLTLTKLHNDLVDVPGCNQLADYCLKMLTISIDYLKPPGWMMYSIHSTPMARIKRCLEQVISVLLNPAGHRMLYVLYIRLREVLQPKQHLEPLLTTQLLKQFYMVKYGDQSGGGLSGDTEEPEEQHRASVCLDKYHH